MMYIFTLSLMFCWFSSFAAAFIKTAGHDVTLICKDQADGIYDSPNACDQYIDCYNQNAYPERCDSGLFYDPVSKFCISKELVPCKGPILAPGITEGCGKNMRLFGPNNRYRCNCKELRYCNFKNVGKCNNEECQYGYGGPFCQKILYDRYLRHQDFPDGNIFTKARKKVKGDLQFQFNNKYRINQIRMTCKPSRRTFSVYFDQTKFCEMSCSQNAKCTGDVLVRNMTIKTASEIEISNVEMSGCSPFWFGEDCDKQCHCAQNSDCHKMTGKCFKGCESGRSGSHCQRLNYVNLALNKSASQSSTRGRDNILANGICKDEYFPFSANLAIDGNTDQQHERLSCMHTENGYSPNWSVDLEKEYSIYEIRIYIRNFIKSNDLNGFDVYVGNQLCESVLTNNLKTSKIIDILCHKRGDSVKIIGRSYGKLQICEVEILQCLTGFYGHRCGNICLGCTALSCDWYGRCLSGCAPGYKENQNKTCTECSTGFYGDRCRNICPGCKDSNCDQRDGRCLSGCADGYKKKHGSTCTEDIGKQGNQIWEDGMGAAFSKQNATGCPANMRKFGTNDQYLCNCKRIDCNFSNYGKCKSNKSNKSNCISGYGGTFCQKIRYHNYLKSSISKEKNVFKNESRQIMNSLNITFEYNYRIHLIKMKCSPPEATISLSIGSESFCEGTCQDIKCRGDATGKDLYIRTTSEISLSNVKVFGCSPFWFGEDCDKQCHCAENKECHKMTGKCSNGCENGRNGSDCQALTYQNVALNKTAKQTSTYNMSKILINDTCEDKNFNFSANLAVDGNTDQQFQRLSCIHTRSESEQNTKWEVDLGKEFNILQIRIYNRNSNQDSVERIIGAKIKVDGKPCYTINTAKKIVDINCSSNITGRRIEITKSKGILNFCEVEVLQCLPGFYGNNCSNQCPECKNSSCDQWSGQCHSGCASGYKKDLNKCTACQVGTFGYGCNQTCHCKNNTECHTTEGTCGTKGCAASYKGEACQETCPVGTFGYGCNQTCHCKNNNECNKINGECGTEGCAARYKGEACQETCPVGTFGDGCNRTCHCKNNNECNTINGECGTEGCAARYKGEACQETCPVGTFGDGCNRTCHCKNNNECNTINGECGTAGCAARYKGEACQEKDELIPLIIGLSVLLLVIVAIGIAIYFRMRKSKKKQVKTYSGLPTISLGENVEMDSVVDNDDENGQDPTDDQENIYMNSESLQQSTMEITRKNILAYVANKKMEELPFAEEFLKLPKGLLYAHNAAKEEKNKSKNRYKTILPYDHSRVLLDPAEHVSSYINANYLTDNKTYIATQGPLARTIVDFWAMVYQTKCNIIVMLTNLSESGKVKSEQYWPDVEMTEKYGKISVSHKRENKYSYYTYREFCITKNSESISVEHYQFTSWPDHGAPKVSEYFIAFRNKIRSTTFYKPPILVHCSAGVGRSGTYIVLDIILEEMENNSKIDVIDCILKLRKDRPFMVQNRSQLEYIYDVLAENVITGHTVMYVHDLPQVYHQLQKFPANSSHSLMQLQFEQLILPLNPATSNCSNKGDTTMSYDNEQDVTDDENNPTSDLTTLNGNNLEEEFILISTPSEEEFADFWSVIFLKRCTLLVMFDNMPNEEAVYWPHRKGSVAKYKHFAVELVDEHHHNCYIKRTLKVSSSKLNMPELLVHQFQFKIWQGTDLPSPKEMVEIIQTVQSSQRSQNQKQIALHCLDGISKNGLFSVLYMIIEILQRDSMISIAQLIRLHRRKKEDIISDYRSYHYCWLVAKVFLEEMSLYSNL